MKDREAKDNNKRPRSTSVLVKIVTTHCSDVTKEAWLWDTSSVVQLTSDIAAVHAIVVIKP